MKIQAVLLWINIWCMFQGYATLSCSEILDPEVDYINTSEKDRAYYGITPSEKIHRLDLDLNRSGMDTIFLVYALSGSKCGPTWTAYSPRSDGMGFDRINGIVFRTDSFFAGIDVELNPTGGILAFYPGGKGGTLVRFPLKNGRLQNGEDIRDLDLDKEKDRELFERITGRKLGVPLPREYFENPPYKVIDVRDIMARDNAPKITASPTPEIPQSTTASTPKLETSPLPAMAQTESSTSIM